MIDSDDSRRGIDIFADQGAPVVAVNDGVIKKIGEQPKLGRYVVLQDVYGNRYTYAHLGSVAQLLPGAEGRRQRPDDVAARASRPTRRPRSRPSRRARARPAARPTPATRSRARTAAARRAEPAAPAPAPPVKERLFAHPACAGAREAGGLEQL